MASSKGPRKELPSWARKQMRLEQRRERLLLQQRVMATALRQVEDQLLQLEHDVRAAPTVDHG